jgi:hypothetical protein
MATNIETLNVTDNSGYLTDIIRLQWKIWFYTWKVRHTCAGLHQGDWVPA